MKYVVSLREFYESGESLVFASDNYTEAENYALFCAIAHCDDFITYVYEICEKPKILCSFSAELDYTVWCESRKTVLKKVEKEVYE